MTLFLLNLSLFLLATVVVLAVAFLAIELVAACLPWPRITAFECAPVKTTVLVPAHNEQSGIRGTIESIVADIGDAAKIVVVADNCTDATAAVARECGAEVIERHDSERRGKGYALDFGFRHLEKDPPDVVIVLDADCRVGLGTIRQLAAAASQWKAPVQGNNQCFATDPNDPRQAISEMAFRVKNFVRPRGLGLLGGPCLLTGTGFALPWNLVRLADVASGNVVEDMRLGVDLTIAGHAPRYLESALIQSDLPTGSSASLTQRTRWEHGHLATAFSQTPRLLSRAWRVGDVQAFALALELAVPPLAILAAVWLAATMTTAVAWLALGATDSPLHLLLGAGATLFLSASLAWLVHCSQRTPLSALAGIWPYLTAKLPLYRRLLGGWEQRWIRTERVANPSAATQR